MAHDTRKRILDATWRLLGEDPRGTRIEDVARAAGITRQALYRHFPDRAQLLVATARHVDEALEATSRTLQDATSARQQLDRYPEILADHLPKISEVVLAMEYVRESDEAVNEALEDRERERWRRCLACVRMLEREGALAPDITAEDGAALMMSFGSPHLHRELTIGRGWSKRKFVTHVRRLLHRALLSEG